MFAGYNKGGKSRTLTGNWVEEQALRNAKSSSETFQRVIKHDHVPESQSCTASSHESQNVSDLGQRHKKKTEEMYARAKELQRNLATPGWDSSGFESAATSSFKPIEPKYIIEQPRAEPRGKNGRISGTKNEFQYETKHEVDQLYQAKLSSYQTNTYSKDTAVSIYSHAIKSGTGLNFSASSSNTTNPFSRSTAFSNDIRDSQRFHGEATMPGSSNVARLGCSVHQRSALDKLKQQLERDSTVKASLEKAKISI